MQSNFVARCKTARELIAVPEIPLVAVLQAAKNRQAPRSESQWKGIMTALLAGVSLVAVAAAAEVWSGAHISFNPSGGMSMALSTTQKLGYKESPTTGDIRAAAQRADFQVVLPAGLPEGATPLKLLSTPNIINIAYTLPGKGRGSNAVFWITLADPRTLAESPGNSRRVRTLRLGSTAARAPVVHWLIGHEAVIVVADGSFQRTLSTAELMRIKIAMSARAHLR